MKTRSDNSDYVAIDARVYRAFWCDNLWIYVVTSGHRSETSDKRDARVVVTSRRAIVVWLRRDYVHQLDFNSLRPCVHELWPYQGRAQPHQPMGPQPRGRHRICQTGRPRSWIHFSWQGIQFLSSFNPLESLSHKLKNALLKQYKVAHFFNLYTSFLPIVSVIIWKIIDYNFWTIFMQTFAHVFELQAWRE